MEIAALIVQKSKVNCWRTNGECFHCPPSQIDFFPFNSFSDGSLCTHEAHSKVLCLMLIFAICCHGGESNAGDVALKLPRECLRALFEVKQNFERISVGFQKIFKSRDVDTLCIRAWKCENFLKRFRITLGAK